MKKLVILLLSIYPLGAYAQYKALKVGDIMPDYVFKNLVNYPSKTARYSDFKGKLVILDLWATTCAGCIASWPKLLDIQKKFGDKGLQIILVNSYEDESVVKKTFKRRKEVAHVDMTLPSVCSDTVLGEQLFPHNGVPHVIIIDKKGAIRSISGSNAINEPNIRALLEEKEVDIVSKGNIKVSPNKPLFINGNGGTVSPSKLQWHSLFVRGDLSLGQTRSWHTNPLRGYYITLLNVCVRDLFRTAYGEYTSIGYGEETKGNTEPEFDWLPLSRVVFNVKNIDNYLGEVEGNPKANLTYIYQLTAPPTTMGALQKRMQADLDLIFGLNIRWEKRKMKCLVFTCNDTSLISYKTGDKIELMGYKVNYRFDINKISMTRLIERLMNTNSYYYGPFPLIDETGLKGYLGSIQAEDVNVEDHKSLDKVLGKYGLRFTLQEREVDVLVINEPPGYVFPYENNPVPGTAKPANVRIRPHQDHEGFIEASFDPVTGAEYYRVEYRKPQDTQWSVIKYPIPSKNIISALINKEKNTADYIIRIAGVGKIIPGKAINDENTSALNYSDEVKLTLPGGN